MRSARLPNYILRCIIILSLQSAFAQDYTQWGLPSGAIARLGKGSISGNIAYSPDGSRLAVACTSGIWLYDAETCQELSLIAGHTDEVSTVTFSPDGTMLASGGGNSEAHGGFDNTVRLWDVASANPKRTLTGHRGYVTSVAFSPDGGTLASASRYGVIRLWRDIAGLQNQTLDKHTSRITCVVFSPDGSTLASASRDLTIRLWDATTGEPKQTLSGHTDWINSIAFSPDGTTLASASRDMTIRLWDSINRQTSSDSHQTEEDHGMGGIDRQTRSFSQ